MKFKTLTLVLLCGANLFAGRTVSAQNPTAPPFHFDKPDLVDLLTQPLSLTDTQKGQVQPIVAAFRPQLEAIHQQAREAEAVVLKQLDVPIRSLLTPEQQTKLDALEALNALSSVGSSRLAQ
jgi:Spy/CpxP family protein refolding chaperone